jgi:excisionase family DNA binding protein
LKPDLIGYQIVNANQSTRIEKQCELLTKKEVAERLRMTPRTVERWMREGFIPYIKFGRGRRASVLFSWENVLARIESRFEIGGSR